jgi:hypothetical protein
MSRARFDRWLLGCLFGGLALVALPVSAQTPSAGPNPGSNAPVVVPPDKAVPPQPPAETWDRPWRIEKINPEDDWTRHFRIGAMVGLNIKADFKMKGTFDLSGKNAAQGIYDDGYVREDNTHNAFGETGYWGYNNASQLSGSTLTMHSASSYSVTGSSEESGKAFAGFDMAYGGDLWRWNRMRIGWDFGFGLLPIDITAKSTMAAPIVSSVYTFNTGTITVPGAPYQGGFNRAGEPTISTNFNPSSVTNNGTVSGSHELDVFLYTFRLGPSLYWEINDYLGLSASAGPALGLVSGDLKYDEVVSVNGEHNRGKVSGTDLVYGGYANASLMYHLEENGEIYVGVQYMPLGDATISGGGREGKLKLGGQVYISAGINWPF